MNQTEVLDLISSLKTETDWMIRRRAAHRLGELTAPDLSSLALQALTEALVDEDTDVLQAAIESLGKLRRREAVPILLLPRWIQHPDPSVRGSVVSALAELVFVDKAPFAVLDALLSASQDPIWRVREEARKGLLSLADHAVRETPRHASLVVLRILCVPDVHIQEQLAQVLGKCGAESPRLREIWLKSVLEDLGHLSHFIRRGAALALGLLGDGRAVSALAERLPRDPDHSVREACVISLGKLRDPASAQPLVRALAASRSTRFCRLIVQALARIGHPAIPHLMTALKKAVRKDFRKFLVEALGLLEAREAADLFVEALEDTYYLVRRAAVRALCRIGTPEIVAKLGTLLHQSEADLTPLKEEGLHGEIRHLRIRAIRALAEMKDSKASPLLKALRRDPDSEIAEEAEEALYMIGRASWGRRCALEVLAEVGTPDVLPSILRSLDDHNQDVRIAAVRALDRLAAEACIPHVLSRLDKEAPEVQQPMIKLLGNLGFARKEVRAAAVRFLTHTQRELRMEAARALGKLCDPESEVALRLALSDPSPMVRHQAEEALDNIVVCAR
ncbi:MAG: HEAT repeat domain-containing protein [Armatimonadetes bacterium]|nr:HEAT repeat domain-containing protein [Armatimonadota bacterium]